MLLERMLKLGELNYISAESEEEEKKINELILLSEEKEKEINEINDERKKERKKEKLTKSDIDIIKKLFEK